MDKQSYVNRLIVSKGFDLSSISKESLDAFVSKEEVFEAIESIFKTQDIIMGKWEINTYIINFQNFTMALSNGTEGEKYQNSFQSDFFSNNNISQYEFENLNDIGLLYNKEQCTIEGVPKNSGDFKIILKFKVKGESDSSEMHTKILNLIINPDPKSLWKNIESDKSAIFWKEDNKSYAGKFGKTSIVVSSKRGRSHQNVGSFRDDDYAFKHFKNEDWSVLAVSDGAGSASLSRKGSEVACSEIISYFEKHIFKMDELKPFEKKIKEFSKSKDEKLLEEAKNDSKQILYKATVHVNKILSELAENTFNENPELFNNSKAKSHLEYFHSTLIFTVFKKFDIGYIFLTFGVGDCPIGIVNKNNESKLLNWLDVGEFGGGTRFITQNDIFHSNERPMSTRFNFHIQKDFSYLFMMTDGIYDAKFVVEANLEKDEKWVEFINDLKGSNDDGIVLDFSTDYKKAEKQINQWMDFWSKGNHDDRTLAIIY